MGIAHHSNYPVWFEAGRSEFFKKIGIWYSKIEEKGILLPLIDLKCSFKSPLRYEEDIIVRTKLVELTCVRLIFNYEILKKNNKKLATIGETSHAWTDKNFKLLNIKNLLPDLYQILGDSLEI